MPLLKDKEHVMVPLFLHNGNHNSFRAWRLGISWQQAVAICSGHLQSVTTLNNTYQPWTPPSNPK